MLIQSRFWKKVAQHDRIIDDVLYIIHILQRITGFAYSLQSSCSPWLSIKQSFAAIDVMQSESLSLNHLFISGQDNRGFEVFCCIYFDSEKMANKAHGLMDI